MWSFYVPEKELDDFARLVAEVEQHLLKSMVKFIPEIQFRLLPW